MAEKLIYTYALAKSLYEEKKDYIDVFVPLLIKVISEQEKPVEITGIPKRINDRYGLFVPLYTVDTLVTRASRNGYIRREFQKALLTDKGQEYLIKIKAEQEIDRRINALVDDIKQFFKSKKFNLSNEEIQRLLYSFINENIESLLEYFQPKALDSIPVISIANKYPLAEYFKIAENKKPDFYKILEDIFFGAIISCILAKTNISQINKKFGQITILLDANFIFSILGLHHPHISQPAIELFDLLKKYNFNIKVFDFTVNEIVQVLKGYIYQENKFIKEINVNTIYSHLKNKSWTSEDCIKYIQQIDETLITRGINIEFTGLDLKTYSPNESLLAKLPQYKINQNINGQKHDLLVIEQIKKYRKYERREIEKCDYLFLTSDLKLAKFNNYELDHVDNFTISEVISDRLLTNLLWLKDPEIIKELPLKTIISINSEILIDKTIWSRFFDNIVNLKKAGSISDSDISALLYYHQLKIELAELSSPDEVTAEFTLDEISAGKEFIYKEIESKVKEAELSSIEKVQEIEQNLKEGLAAEKEEKAKAVDKLTQIRRAVEAGTEKTSRRIANFSIYGVFIIFVIFCFFIIMKLKPDSVLAFRLAIGSIVIGIFTMLGFQLNLKNIKSNLKSNIYDYLLKKRFSKFKLG